MEDVKISSRVVNSNQLQITNPYGFVSTTEGQFNLTQYLRSFLSEYNTGSIIDANPSSVTGTVSETILKSLLIPANTVKTGSVVELNFKLSTTGYYILKCGISPTPVIGATFYPILWIGTGSTFSQYERKIHVIDQTLSSQYIVNLLQGSDDTVQSINQTNSAIDWSVDNYFIITAALTSISDTAIAQYVNINYINP